MTLPPVLTTLLNNAGKLHITSDAIKVLGILAGVAFGVFGHDWQTGGEVAIAALGASAGVSQMARKATN
ncbi:MAG: hypothetical protein KGJ13_05755 [Patescibacteria group bacterium]|nr:hypothetical protein [Patescibacteria group bacterium]